MIQKLIIDVSEHQGKIDWAALKPNIDGAIIRCGFGDDDKTQDDKQWSYNVAECERLKIPYGVYLYSYADTTAHVNSEIAHVKRLLKGHKPQYPVYIDLEESRYGNIAKKASDAFCKAIKDAGYIPGVYTYESFYNAYMRGWNAYTLWIAKYGINDGKPHDKPNIGVSFDAWQYSSNARISGFDGRLDVSYFYRTWAAQPSAATGTAAKVLEIARGEIGRNDGTKYGKWYESSVDMDSSNYNFAARGVPYCAMFVSWVLAQANVKCAGLPGAYCPTMLAAAKSAKKTVATDKAQPGDIVYFDWDGGVTDHVGIVEGNSAVNKSITTIEGNTDNGEVKRKYRSYSSIVGVVRPDYATVAEEPATVDTSVTFRLSTDSNGKTWLKANAQCASSGAPIRWIAIKGAGKYRVCTRASGWLPYVSKYSISDLEYGCAGDGSPITAVEVKSNKYRYAVRVLGSKWYPDMIGTHDTGGTNDPFAGDLANAIDGFRIRKN